MHKSYFKLSALVIGLGMSIAANADVTVPSLQGGFKVELEANYLKPYGLNTIYATKRDETHIRDTNVEILNRKHFKTEPKFNWGLGIKLAYVFPNTANDISLIYSRYKGATESSASWENVTTWIYPDEKIEGRIPWQAKTKFEAKQEQIDLLLGQYLQLGSNTQLHLTTGLSYAELAVSGITDVALLPTTFYEEQTDKLSKFKGLGPSLGLDLVYSLGNSGWGLRTGLQTALLVGKKDSSSRVSISQYNPFNASKFIDHRYSIEPTRTVVIPAIAAKLGLNYERSLNSAYSLGVEAGYQVNSYLNAYGLQAKLNNFTLAGPYTNFKLSVY